MVELLNETNVDFEDIDEQEVSEEWTFTIEMVREDTEQDLYKYSLVARLW